MIYSGPALLNVYLFLNWPTIEDFCLASVSCFAVINRK